MGQGMGDAPTDDATLRSAAVAMRHSSAMASSRAYDKERGNRLSAAAVAAVGESAAKV